MYSEMLMIGVLRDCCKFLYHESSYCPMNRLETLSINGSISCILHCGSVRAKSTVSFPHFEKSECIMWISYCVQLHWGIVVHTLQENIQTVHTILWHMQSYLYICIVTLLIEIVSAMMTSITCNSHVAMLSCNLVKSCHTAWLPKVKVQRCLKEVRGGGCKTVPSHIYSHA